MSVEPYDYPSMMQRALRGVVREALGRAAEEGLPGQHHFYITIDTTSPGVDLPDTVDDQLGWLAEAGLSASVVFAEGDLAVLRADRS